MKPKRYLLVKKEISAEEAQEIKNGYIEDAQRNLAEDAMLMEASRMAHRKKCELKQFSYDSESGMAEYWAKEILE